MKWLLILLKIPTFFLIVSWKMPYFILRAVFFYINLLFEILKYRNSHYAVRVAREREMRQERKSVSLRSEKMEKWEGDWVTGSWWLQLQWSGLVHPTAVKLCREGPGDSRCCRGKSSEENISFTNVNFRSSSTIASKALMPMRLTSAWGSLHWAQELGSLQLLLS